MNIVKNAFLLAGLLTAGSCLAHNPDALGRHVIKPEDVVLAQDVRSTDASVGIARGHIDADVLNFRHKRPQEQVVI